MYRIIKIDGTELGITDSVNYIKIGASGDLTNATETDAIGVAFNSEPYNLLGHDDIDGSDTIIAVSYTHLAYTRYSRCCYSAWLIWRCM